MAHAIPILIIVFFLPLGSLLGQSIDNPYDQDFSGSILSYANPTNNIDVIRWGDSYGGAIVSDRSAAELNGIYRGVLGDIYSVYQKHGISTRPEMDGTRFQTLQEAINSRVQAHNDGVYSAYVLGTSIGGGIGILGGAIAGWVLWKRHFTRTTELRSAVKWGLVVGVCGAALGFLGAKVLTNPMPEFSGNNSEIREEWNRLESLSTKNLKP